MASASEHFARWFDQINKVDAADVAKDLLGEDFSGIVTSDRYGGYDGAGRQQLCWAHWLRDIQSLIEAGGEAKAIGRRLKTCGETSFHDWHRDRNGTITRQTIRRNIHKLWWPAYETLEEGTLKLQGKQAGLCRHI